MNYKMYTVSLLFILIMYISMGKTIEKIVSEFTQSEEFKRYLKNSLYNIPLLQLFLLIIPTTIVIFVYLFIHSVDSISLSSQHSMFIVLSEILLIIILNLAMLIIYLIIYKDSINLESKRENKHEEEQNPQAKSE